MSEEIFPNEQLRRVRSLKGWSQEKLAEELGTISTIVSRWERGINAPSPYFRERLCEVLGKTAEELGLLPSSQKPSPLQEKPSLMTPLQQARDTQETAPVMARPSLLPVAQRNRERLRRRVHAFWITGVLERSLHGAALIALGLQQQPNAVAHPWHLILQQAETAPLPLPTGMRIRDVYDVSNGELLILGAPGSGKTTLLLELARDLLLRAQDDEYHPLPVIFNLSSWAMKRQSLADWLAEELNSKYQVPSKLAQTLVAADQILPLLDGLDEIALKERAACIEAINTYRQEHGLVPLVVCSRSTDYLTQATRVRLGCAVEVQPLTDQQIDDYLASAGERLEALRVALHQDASLREMTSTPLMLSILTLTYLDASTQDLSPTSSPIDRQQHIFDHYIARMLTRRRSATSYPPQLTRRWLVWLAQQMEQHNQTVFYIERMQPDWFSNGWLRHFYNFIVRLGIILACGAIFLLPGGLAGGLLFGTGFSMLFGVIFGLLFGLMFGLTSQVKTTITPAEIVSWSWTTMWQQLVKIEIRHALIRVLPGGLIYTFLGGLLLLVLNGGKIAHGTANRTPLVNILTLGMLCGILAMFLFGLFNGFASELPCNIGNKHPLTVPRHGLHNRLFAALLFGLLVGLVFGSVFGQITNPTNGLLAGLVFGGCSMLMFAATIRVKTKLTLVEVMSQLWKHIWLTAVTTQLRSVLVVFLGTWLMAYIIEMGNADNSLYIALLGAVAFRLLMGIINGLSSDMLAECTLVKPNQGIWSSMRNSAFIGLIFGIIGGLLFGLIFALAITLQGTLGEELPWLPFFGLIGGAISGLAVGLPNGGIACIQHVTLRLFLWILRKIPWNYIQFLDYGSDHILLRKVGGGYIFVHRLLLEHFASMNI